MSLKSACKSFVQSIEAAEIAIRKFETSDIERPVPANDDNFFGKAGPKDEPRDDHGRWTNSGGGAGSAGGKKPKGAKPKGPSLTRLRQRYRHVKETRQRIRRDIARLERRLKEYKRNTAAYVRTAAKAKELRGIAAEFTREMRRLDAAANKIHGRRYQLDPVGSLLAGGFPVLRGQPRRGAKRARADEDFFDKGRHEFNEDEPRIPKGQPGGGRWTSGDGGGAGSSKKPKGSGKKPAGAKKPRAKPATSTGKPKTQPKKPRKPAAKPKAPAQKPRKPRAPKAPQASGLDLRDRTDLEHLYREHDKLAQRLDEAQAHLNEERPKYTTEGYLYRNARIIDSVRSMNNQLRAIRSDIRAREARLGIGARKRLIAKRAHIAKKTASLYVHRKLLNGDDVHKWAKAQGFDSTVHPDDMHVTVAASRDALKWPDPNKLHLHVKPSGNRQLDKFGDNHDVAVLRFNSKHLHNRNAELQDAGASSDFEEYKPHVTISHMIPHGLDLSKVKPYSGPLLFGPEEHREFNDNPEHVEKAREVLRAHELKKREGQQCALLKADDKLGLIFGWAIVSSQDGKPYYDTQGDHIPEDAMVHAAADFMEHRRTMKIMHGGKKVGTVVFAWPMTEDIAQAMGIAGKRTGLMIAVKPDNPNVMRRFKNGEYTGFSIGGNRILDEEVG